MRVNTCHDCGCKEGEIHEYGCDMECCPFCSGQLISCGCCYKQLGYIDYEFTKEPYCGLPKDVYEKGLPDSQHLKWMHIIKEKGRIPYIHWPNLCAYCGALWPDIFKVPDEEWEKYIQSDMRDQMICTPCYNKIKTMIDKGTAK